MRLRCLKSQMTIAPPLQKALSVIDPRSRWLVLIWPQQWIKRRKTFMSLCVCGSPASHARTSCPGKQPDLWKIVYCNLQQRKLEDNLNWSYQEVCIEVTDPTDYAGYSSWSFLSFLNQIISIFRLGMKTHDNMPRHVWTANVVAHWLCYFQREMEAKLTALSVVLSASLLICWGVRPVFLMNSGMMLFPNLFFLRFIPFQHRADLTVFEIWGACWIMSGVPPPKFIFTASLLCFTSTDFHSTTPTERS